MTTIYIPAEQDTSYPPARGPVLLLSCIDPRLLDDTVQFMNHDNLCNRYDHITFAGAALGALGGGMEEYAHWKRTFFDHLAGAYKLHQIEEVYILEHRNCGAYHKLFKVAGMFDDSEEQQELEKSCHRKYTELLKNEILQWAVDHNAKLQVKSFLMDLRGKVTMLR